MTICNPEDLADVFRPHVPDVIEQEIVMVAYLIGGRVLHSEITFMGGLDSASVDPRIIFRRALRHGASQVALAHTHPTGDPTPSSKDYKVTRRLSDGGRLLAIELVDHLVFGSYDEYVSILSLDSSQFV